MDRREFAGFSVVIESPVGSSRQWYDRESGESGSTFMVNDYGFLPGHAGSDGDDLDVYLGPDEGAEWVYIVHQLLAPDFARHDEDKVFLGFRSEQDALAAFLAHRSDGRRSYGGMTALTVGAFRAKLGRRTGSGKIRHEGLLQPRRDPAYTSAQMKTKAEKRIDSAARQGEALRFDAGGASVRVGVWDRICVPGRNCKDGEETVFDAVTCSQMVKNFGDRGDPVMIDWNHQSSYSHANGQPAPALGFYGALAAVFEGKVVAFACARSAGSQPEPTGLEDGLWGLRTSVTKQGQELLPGFQLLSPTFTPEGVNQLGEPIGYQLLAVAATNTPWQAGTRITFDREQRFASDRDSRPLAVGDSVLVHRAGTGGDEAVIVEIDRDLLIVRLPSGERKAVGSQNARKMEHSAVAMGIQPGQATWRDQSGIEVTRCPRCKQVFPAGLAGARGECEDCEGKMMSSAVAMANDANGKPLAEGDEVASAANPNAQKGTITSISGDSVSVWWDTGMRDSGPGQHLVLKRQKMEGIPAKSAVQVKKTSTMGNGVMDAKGATRMNPEMMAKLGLSEGASPEEKEAAFAAYMTKMEGGGEAAPPSAMEGDKEPDGDEKKPEEMEKEPDGDEDKQALAQMSRSLGLPAGSSARLVAQAMSARTVGLDKVAVLERQVAELTASRAAEQKADRLRAAELAFESAVSRGRTKADKRDVFVAAYERNPKDAEGLLFEAGTFASKEILMSRMTQGGSPIGGASIRDNIGGSGNDQRVVSMSALGNGARAVVFGERLSAAVNAMADSVDPVVRARIDAALPPAAKGSKYESYERYLAAEKIITRERPELVEAASENRT